MKILINYTLFLTFIYLAVGIGGSILSEDPAEIWGGGLLLLIVFVGSPWALLGLFKLFLLALYHTRKAWVQAAQDAKQK